MSHRSRLHPLPPVEAPSTPPSKVAVVLNARARGFSEGMVRDLRSALQGETLYVSHSAEQAEFIARHIVNRGFEVVLCGGGDGTFTRVVSDVLSLSSGHAPCFGVLRLGTGNALASALGAARGNAGGLVSDVRQARDTTRRVSLPLLKVANQLAPFAGVGLDALVLEDYGAVKATLSKTPLARVSTGPMGYGLAVATRSLWRYLSKPLPRVVIRNEGAAARKIDLRGCPIGDPIARGEIIYQGPVTIAAASTIPFYGFGMRLFPQAGQRGDRFQLRIGNIGALGILRGLPALFSGGFDSDALWDFSCTAISIHSLEPTPFQAGGDLVGLRRRVFIGMQRIDAVAGSRKLLPRLTPRASTPVAQLATATR